MSERESESRGGGGRGEKESWRKRVCSPAQSIEIFQLRRRINRKHVALPLTSDDKWSSSPIASIHYTILPWLQSQLIRSHSYFSFFFIIITTTSSFFSSSSSSSFLSLSLSL